MKFDDAKKKALNVLAGLKDADLTIEGQGPSLEQGGDQSPNRFNGMPNQGTDKPRVKITEQLKLTLTHADKADPAKLMAAVLKTLDAARDAGLTVGPPAPRNYYEAQNQTGALATFHIADATPLLDQAMAAAVGRRPPPGQAAGGAERGQARRGRRHPGPGRRRRGPGRLLLQRRHRHARRQQGRVRQHPGRDPGHVQGLRPVRHREVSEK